MPSQLPDIDEISRSEPRGRNKRTCHLCKGLKDALTFKSKPLDEVYKINRDYNKNSKTFLFKRISGSWWTVYWQYEKQVPVKEK